MRRLRSLSRQILRFFASRHFPHIGTGIEFFSLCKPGIYYVCAQYSTVCVASFGAMPHSSSSSVEYCQAWSGGWEVGSGPSLSVCVCTFEGELQMNRVVLVCSLSGLRRGRCHSFMVKKSTWTSPVWSKNWVVFGCSSILIETFLKYSIMKLLLSFQYTNRSTPAGARAKIAHFKKYKYGYLCSRIYGC